MQAYKNISHSLIPRWNQEGQELFNIPMAKPLPINKKGLLMDCTLDANFGAFNFEDKLKIETFGNYAACSRLTVYIHFLLVLDITLNCTEDSLSKLKVHFVITWIKVDCLININIKNQRFVFGMTLNCTEMVLGMTPKVVSKLQLLFL